MFNNFITLVDRDLLAILTKIKYYEKDNLEIIIDRGYGAFCATFYNYIHKIKSIHRTVFGESLHLYF